MKKIEDHRKRYSVSGILQTAKKILKATGKEALSILYPARCMLCDGFLYEGKTETGLCKICEERMPIVGKTFCLRCGKALSDTKSAFCSACEENKGEHSFDGGRSLLVYTDEVAGMLARYKFGNRRDYAPFFADMMVKGLRAEIFAMRARVLIPVPLHQERLAERGFDQAALLAEELALRLNRERQSGLGEYRVCHLLRRFRHTKPMKELGYAERVRNMEQALALAENVKRVPASVIIVDDIYTTGSTIDACTRMLRSAGVKKVWFLTLATGKD